MTKLLTLSTHIGFLLIVIILMSTIKLPQVSSSRNLPMADMATDDDDSEVEEERRANDFNQLRRFLLTANAEERAAKREQQDFYKRELVNKLNIFVKKQLINFFLSLDS